ncbi:MAG: four helix bundle protein [Candidatus Saccharibacteria bacterium]|nr:four helix bundle protein [Candidatus Saccharibacteria bacterium]
MQNVAKEKATKFTDLVAWQKGHGLVVAVYEATSSFPPEEKFSLTNQIRRSVVSITSNLAEGFGRQSRGDKGHFYTIARGSILELQNQLIIARDIKILDKDEFNKLTEKSIIVHKLVNGLIKSLSK